LLDETIHLFHGDCHSLSHFFWIGNFSKTTTKTKAAADTKHEFSWSFPSKFGEWMVYNINIAITGGRGADAFNECVFVWG